MKRLVLLRHAKAEAKDAAEDFERVLAPRGRAQMGVVARHLAETGLRPDLAILSPSARTRETWSLAKLKDVPVQEDERIYEASSETLLDVLRGASDEAGTVVLVGHNPGFEELATELVRTGPEEALGRMRRGYPTGGLAVIEFDVETWRAVSPRTGRLVSFETPASLGSGPED